MATARPAFLHEHPEFLADAGLTTIRVAPLGGNESRGLVDHLLPTGSIPAELRATVVGRAEGNPYFLEETVRHLIEAGQQPIPDSIQAVLAARIETLPLAERRVLQEAAVVGRVFWEGPIRRALGAADIGQSLARLAERGLIFTRPTSSLSGEVELSFKHALLRDAAYGTMTGAHRARSHASVGAWLEGISDDPESELAGLIGEHLRLAIEQGADGEAWPDAAEREDVRARAVRYLLIAGSSAHQRFALDKAVELHEAALRHAATDAERARALAALGQDRESGLDGPAALERYRAAIAAADRADLPAEEQARILLLAARTLALRWGAFPVRPDPADIDHLVDAGLELAEDPETRLWLLAMRGAAGIRWGAVRLTEPEFVAERAAAVTAAIDGARRLGLHDLVVVAGRISGQLEFAAGRYPESAAAYRGLVPNLDAVDSVFQRALTAMYVVLGLADVAGAYDEALAVARDVLTLGRTLTAHEHAHGTSSILWCQYHLGDWAEMEPLVEEHLSGGPGRRRLHLPVHARRRPDRRPDRGPPRRPRPGPPADGDGPADGRGAGSARGAPCPRPRRPRGGRGGRRRGPPDDRQRPSAEHRGQRPGGPRPDRRAPRPRRLGGAPGVPADGPRLPRDARDPRAVLRPRGGARARGRWRCRGRDRDPPRGAGGVRAARRPLRGIADDGDPRPPPAGRRRDARRGDGRGGVAPRRASGGPEGTPAAAPDPRPAATTAAATLAAAAASVDPGLTEREREILGLVGEGISNGAIAERLGLSPRTVERHVSNIYLKLGFEGRSSRAAAASYAVRASIAREEPG